MLNCRQLTHHLINCAVLTRHIKLTSKRVDLPREKWQSMKRKVTVVGCGVSGLTTGIVLLRAGYAVHIMTESLPQDTVSARAAALWFPFQIGPVEQANTWSKVSYDVFLALSGNPAAGVQMRPLLELIETEADAWWRDALPQHAIRQARPEELPADFKLGYVIKVPIIETPIYLDWLMQYFTELGGTLSQEKVHKLDDLQQFSDVVVNCTGLGARELVGDEALYPIRGQIVKVAADPDIACVAADMHLWGSETDLAYIIPRSDCIVLGGNALPGNADIAADDAATRGILHRCQILDARIADLPVLSVEVGIRPGRKEIRLAREGKVIHNYGHGGGGYTVSWGCAEAVLDLVNAMQQ
jgi:D-amino-acid oxidase